MAILAENKKAKYNYEILERYEAGLELTGQEVKALRQRGVSLYGNYIAIKRKKMALLKFFGLGQTFLLINLKTLAHLMFPQRDRKLLLHKKEINELNVKIKERGLTLIPLLVYTKNHRLKMEIGLAKGKKAFDQNAKL